MAILENILLAISGLRTSKMRAFLTMLGIIIGIGSVIAIMTVGDSMTNSVANMLNDMGASSIQVGINNKMDENGNYTNVALTDGDYMTMEMIEEYQEIFADQIHGVAISENVGSGQMKNGRLEAKVSFAGTNADYPNTTKITMVAGHYLNDREVKASKNVAVISDRAAEKLFGVQDPLGKEVKLYIGGQIQTFYVVGVYKYEANAMMSMMMGGETPTSVYIPVTTAKRVTGDNTGYNYIQVRAKTGVDLDAFGVKSASFFNRYYRGNPNFEIIYYSMEGMISQMTSQMDVMKTAISVIAAISLLVGGIGVMNIMLVSVTERTREIGTRKALGATNMAIRGQFIVEAMIICLIGGIIGILLGVALGYGGSSLLGFPGWPSPSIVVIAVGFSMLIGVFFGYYPASKAAKLDPIEALRYE